MASGMFTLKVSDNGALTREIRQRAKTFADLERKARVEAARIATVETKKKFTRQYPEVAGRTSKKRSSPGGMMSHVKWEASSTGSHVALDLAALDSKAPYWIIQEIGTNQSATLKRGGSPNPRGTPKKGASYVKTVKSQKGRPISRGLVWGTTGGAMTHPDRQRRRRDQIQARRGLRDSHLYGNFHQVVIQKEIEGQHFVRDGAAAAFRAYRPSVRAAAQNAFGGRPRR